jgi:nucleotide-binding universal stress UspA family protein
VGRFYHRIMVPLDATGDSEHALPYALRLAELEQATVALVHVSAPPASLAMSFATAGAEGYAAAMNDDVVTEIERQVEKRLTALANEIEQVTPVHAETAVLDDPDIGRALSDYIEKTGPGLIVMTTHDRTRLERWLLGSMAESLVRRLSAPTLLVKATEARAPLTERVTIDHILVPLDGSELSRAILPHARVMATLTGARVTLFTVIEPVLVGPPPGMPGAAAPVPSEVEARAELSAALSEQAAELRELGLKAEAMVVVDPSPRRAILDYAEAQGVNLIAMSTHGRRGLAKLMAGSVAMEVLHHTTVPMLMYRPGTD